MKSKRYFTLGDVMDKIKFNLIEMFLPIFFFGFFFIILSLSEKMAKEYFLGVIIYYIFILILKIQDSYHKFKIGSKK